MQRWLALPRLAQLGFQLVRAVAARQKPPSLDVTMLLVALAGLASIVAIAAAIALNEPH